METKKLNLEYEDLCFRYKKFIAGDTTINFSTNDFDILFNKITELEQENINNEINIDKLYNENNKLDKDFNELKIRYKKLYTIYLKQKEKIDYLEKNKFIPKKKIQQITEHQIQEIKNLRKNGLSYSEIERQTKWSKYTISRVLNGHYDAK